MHVRPRRLAAWLSAFALVLVTAGCASSAVSTDATATPDEQLQQLLDRWRQRADLPAVTLAVDGPGYDRFVTASGTEERGGDTAVTADAQFRVASTTKLFVATVVLQLVEEGRLGLDGPVATYVPGFRHARGVTIRQLLNHTSGIPDYTRTDQFHEGLLEHRDRVWSTDELLALVAAVRRDFAPGTAYLYSNTGYLLLGRVIDTVTGSTWATEIRRRILDPLRMRHTYVASAEPLPGGVLPGYIDVDMDGDVENVETGGPWAGTGDRRRPGRCRCFHGGRSRGLRLRAVPRQAAQRQHLEADGRRRSAPPAERQLRARRGDLAPGLPPDRLGATADSPSASSPPSGMCPSTTSSSRCSPTTPVPTHPIPLSSSCVQNWSVVTPEPARGLS
jgi:CubicO group peptidase (beta-lactamase class C family)